MKQVIGDLAIFGGPSTFDEPLHVGRPNIGDRKRLLERINAILDTRWLTNAGPVVQEFERRIAAFAGVRHCVAMCNGTVAMEIAIRASGLTGEVIVPSFTFIATAHALQWQEITPVFCDIDASTHNIDVDRIEELITPRTTGILGVHLWGRPCQVDALQEIADRHGLHLLFDAAHAFGCSWQGKSIGSFGTAEVFSFHATKFVNSAEGGAVVTNDDTLAEKMRLMKNFSFAGYDNVIDVGTNGKMSELSAAMGLTSLESIASFVDVNRRNYVQYQDLLKGIDGLSLITYDPTETNNYQYIVLEIDETLTRINRDVMLEILHAENVLARRYFYPGCHRMKPYASSMPTARSRLPETEAIAERVLLLPNGTATDSQQVESICKLLQFLVEHGAEISSRLDECSTSKVPTT